MEFLGKLHDVESIDSELYNTWMAHRFVSPFHYSLMTIEALGGPNQFQQLHEVFQFPLDALRNKFALKVISICVIDIVAFFEKMFPRVEVRHRLNPSEYLILSKAIELLGDVHIDAQTVCDLISDLFFVIPSCEWLLETILVRGVDPGLIGPLVEGVPVLRTAWPTINGFFKRRQSRVFLTQFASHLARVHPDKIAHFSCQAILAALGDIEKENVGLVIESIVRIGKVFPDLSPAADLLLESLNSRFGAYCDGAIQLAVQLLSSQLIANTDP
jgi:hypothetical protein